MLIVLGGGTAGVLGRGRGGVLGGCVAVVETRRRRRRRRQWWCVDRGGGDGGGAGSAKAVVVGWPRRWRRRCTSARRWHCRCARRWPWRRARRWWWRRRLFGGGGDSTEGVAWYVAAVHAGSKGAVQAGRSRRRCTPWRGGGACRHGSGGALVEPGGGEPRALQAVAKAALHAGSAAAVEACSAVVVAVMATADVVVMVWWTATVALLRGGRAFSRYLQEELSTTGL